MGQPPVDTEKRHFPASVTGFLFAPVLWACYFVALYSLEGAACRKSYFGLGTAGLEWQNFALVGLMIACALAMLGVGVWNLLIWLRLRRDPPLDPRSKRSQRQFLALTGAMICGMFCVGTVWIGVSPVSFAACH